MLPPREVLFEQSLRRARNGEYEEWWDKKRLIRPLKHKLRMAFHRITQAEPEAPERVPSQPARSVWLGPGARAGGRSAGRPFSTACRPDRGDVRLVYVTPEPLQGGHPRFRLLRSV